MNDDAPTDAGARTGRLFARPWLFVQGAPDARTLPPAGPLEVAFAGRSNVGKSSLINALVNHRALARTSNTPGRTQELNFFAPEGLSEPPPVMLVDLPGHGFAKAPHARVKAWTGAVHAYLAGRPTLARVFLLVDARHGLKAADEPVMALLDKAAIVYQCVLTKADKVKAADIARVEAQTGEALRKRPAAHPDILVTSARTGLGLERLRAEIARLAGID